MSFINRICDKVYVINLDKDTDKLKKFDEQMKKNQIIYERFPAILGSKIDKDTRFTDYCNNFCTDGMKGCALSHRSLWEKVVEKKYNSILIFEDDAQIPDTFDRDVKNAWYQMPKDYDIVYFGAIFGGNDSSISNTIFMGVKGMNISKENDDIFKIQGTSGAHSYIITKNACQKIISKKINNHIDLEIIQWTKEMNLNTYTFNKNLIQQNHENSNLSDTYPILLNSLLKPILINNVNSYLDWALGENLLNIGYNINGLILLLMILLFFLPSKYYYIVFIWLTVEFLVSFDFDNTLRFGVFLSIPMILMNLKRVQQFMYIK